MPASSVVLFFTRNQRHQLFVMPLVGSTSLSSVSSPAFLSGEDESGRQVEGDLVLFTGIEVVETVDAVGTGGRGCRRVVRGSDHAVGATTGQRHGHAGDAKFTAVLQTVAVVVFPKWITAKLYRTNPASKVRSTSPAANVVVGVMPPVESSASLSMVSSAPALRCVNSNPAGLMN